MSTRQFRRASMARALATVLVGALTLAGCGVATTPPLKATGLPASSINIALQTTACAAAQCIAVGATSTPLPTTATAERLTKNGALAQLATPPFTAGAFTSASCTATLCYLAGSQDGHDVLWSYDPTTQQLAPVSQAALHLPGSSTGITALSCDPTDCAYLDQTTAHVTRLVTFGASGERASDVPLVTDEHVDALGCATNGVCFVPVSGGASARVLSTGFTSSAWTVTATPATWTTVTAISCLAQCVYVANTAQTPSIAWSDLKGWHDTALHFIPSALACIPGQRCVVVGEHSDSSGAASWWHKGSGRDVTLTYVPTPLTTVACGLTRCFAAGTTTAVELAP